MKVLCVLLEHEQSQKQALAEACLALSPQIAIGADAVFLEIEGSLRIFTMEECINHLRKAIQTLELKARIAIGNSVSEAIARARYGIHEVELLPIQALSDYLQPFSPMPISGLELFAKLGVLTLGDFKKIPRVEIPSRFGKQGLLAYERLLSPHQTAWPRWAPAEKIFEQMNFECAAQIHVFEPVLFLLKALLERIFLRLYARNLKLGAFQIKLHLNKFSQTPDLVFHFELPLPQSEVKGVLQILSERLQKNLQQSPLKEALEGISMEVTHTVPSRGSQRNFFSKREEEIQALASLLASLEERLGAGKSFQARPSPRLLPEASWARVQAVNFRHTVENTLAADKPHLGAKWDSENFQKAPLRPLHLLNPPIRIQRMGAELFWPKQKSWRVKSFLGPERLEGEWWLGGFLREYFRVETDNGETLWIFKTKKDQKEHAASELWLHGFYD